MAYIPSQNATNNIAFLMEQMNMPYEVAIAYTANQMGESGKILNPLARNAESGAYGYSQWLGSRLDNLNSFRATLPANTPEFIVQQKFFQQELNPTSPYADTLSIQRHNALVNKWKAHDGSMTLPDLVRGVEKAFFRSRPGGYEGELSDEDQVAFFNSMAERMQNAELLTGKNLGAGYYKMMKDKDINPMDLMNYINAPRKTFMGGISDLFTDNQGKGDRSLDRAGFFNDLALAFNSMRLKPDQNLAMGLMESNKANTELKLLRDNKNKTVTWLRKNGRTDLIPLVGTMDADDLVELAQTNPKEYTAEQQRSIMALSAQAGGRIEGYEDRRDAYRKIMSAFEEGGGISDYTLVTEYAKLLDPRSAVNNKEADAIAGAGGFTTNMLQIIAREIGVFRDNGRDLESENLNKEGFLPADVRRQIANLTMKSYKRYSEEAVNLLEGFYEQGRAFGVKPGHDSFIYRNTTQPDQDWRTAWTNIEGVDVPEGSEFRFDPFKDLVNMPAPEAFIQSVLDTPGNTYSVDQIKNEWNGFNVKKKRQLLRDLGLRD